MTLATFCDATDPEHGPVSRMPSGRATGRGACPRMPGRVARP
jgi:hypothetical protein